MLFYINLVDIYNKIVYIKDNKLKGLEGIKVYTLYIEKPTKLKVMKARKVLQDLDYTDEIKKYNDNLFYCSNRKPLVDKANEIKEEWIIEIKEQLINIENIKI